MIELAYWHWLVFGVLLVLSEIVLTTFFILWFGVAAILVGILLIVFPDISLNWQIFIWTIFSVLFALFWFKYLKPLSVDRTKAGLSREAIVGQVGQVISTPNDDRRGLMRFSVPIVGADEWTFITEDIVVDGDRVRVVDVSGNSLVIVKV